MRRTANTTKTGLPSVGQVKPPRDSVFAKLVRALPWLLISALSAQAICMTLVGGVTPDEFAHIHYMWLVHRLFNANVDFLCPYPTVFYRLFGFLLDVFPQNAVFILYARLVALLFLGTMAFLMGRICREACGVSWPGVLVILLPVAGSLATFHEFRPDNCAYALFLAGLLLLCRWPKSRLAISSAAFLTVFSLCIMPKHVLLAAGAALGFLTMGCVTKSITMRGSLPWAFLGLLAALIGVTVTIRPELGVFPEFVKLAQRNALAEKGLVRAFFLQLCSAVHWPSAVVLLSAPLFAILGFVTQRIRILRRNPMPWQCKGIMLGVLCGGIAHASLSPCPYSQNQSVLYMAMAIGIPLTAGVLSLVPWAILSVALGGIYLVNLWPATRHALDTAPTLWNVEVNSYLLKIIPENEYVVAPTYTGPVFRNEPTYHYCSDNPAYREAVPAEKKRLFTADYFYQRLCSTRPAYFCFAYMSHQPPEYFAACQRYLSENGGAYAVVSYASYEPGAGGLEMLVRSDLLGLKK